MALSTSATARWTILSSSVGMPSGRCRPSAFGMYAPLHAGGQVPEVVLPCLAVVTPRLPIDACGGGSLQREVRRSQPVDVVHVVQQRGEPLCPVPLRCLTYPLDAIRRRNPARCPVAVPVARVAFGQPASLRRLRRRFHGLVRRLPWYYRAVRLPVLVHHRRESLDFPTRPARLIPARDHGLSRFPNAVLPRMHRVSDRARFRRASRWRPVGCSLPPISTASAPRFDSLFRGSIPGLRIPLSTLRPTRLPALTHDSGPLWVATPSTFRTCIYCTAPISPAHGEQEFRRNGAARPRQPACCAGGPSNRE
jgi:hypothetical protein